MAGEESILVGGVDSWFDPDRLEALDRDRRLHGPETENGFIPGEGAAFVRLSRRPAQRLGSIQGIASEREPRPYGSNEPCHALGISLAATRALETLGPSKIGWALTDVVGERHRVEEWLFAAGRVQQQFTGDAQHEQPLMVTGDLGAASAIFLLVHACTMWRIGAAPSTHALIAAHSDGAERGAMLVTGGGS
jgi:3-oxoacyl-[acyl-carrier-protein] synthase-1